MPNNCPCGSGRPYTLCCEPIINGKSDAITAQELMRSRYTAFTLANVNYLMRSHHSSTRPNKERKSIEKWAKSVRWIGLNVLNTQAGEATDETGYVEFKALFMENGQLQQLHERSFFQRENGKWVYVSGTMY
ncbi:MAG: YchJ family metal-binding protein [Bacteroidota bacterium]|nr:YchJ family metal-binding protein [Bacteroidota bacterium]